MCWGNTIRENREKKKIFLLVICPLTQWRILISRSCQSRCLLTLWLDFKNKIKRTKIFNHSKKIQPRKSTTTHTKPNKRLPSPAGLWVTCHNCKGPQEDVRPTSSFRSHHFIIPLFTWSHTGARSHCSFQGPRPIPAKNTGQHQRNTCFQEICPASFSLLLFPFPL